MARILFIGPTFNGDDASIGGTTTSFELLLKQACAASQPHALISVNASRHQLLSAAWLLLQVFWKIPLHDVVMLNASLKGATILAPVIAFYTRLWRKNYVFRMFGGGLIETYQASSARAQRRMQNSIFGADRVYLQTQRMITYFEHLSEQIRWLPTSRLLHTPPTRTGFHGKFVYIGQIKKKKGIDLLIRLAESRGDIQLRVYGPIQEPEYDELKHKPYYGGVLSPDEVSNVLGAHDVLLLPTFYPGEGYPGIVIEAFAAGVPVIATRWLAIPELVHHESNGLLIQPHSYEELERAVDSITVENYRRLSSSALSDAKQFDADAINTSLLNDLNTLASQNRH